MRRSPRGGRGLKFPPRNQGCDGGKSLSSRRAWIEMSLKRPTTPDRRRRSPRGGRGLKSKKCAIGMALPSSLSSRRAWIEIGRTADPRHRTARSLSSRRAWIEIEFQCKDGQDFVGRSPRGGRGLKSCFVPSLAISSQSLSSRRAWIEMVMQRWCVDVPPVALLAEGVD